MVSFEDRKLKTINADNSAVLILALRRPGRIAEDRTAGRPGAHKCVAQEVPLHPAGFLPNHTAPPRSSRPTTRDLVSTAVSRSFGSKSTHSGSSDCGHPNHGDYPARCSPLTWRSWGGVRWFATYLMMPVSRVRRLAFRNSVCIGQRFSGTLIRPSLCYWSK
jgi:hypothetical protein